MRHYLSKYLLFSSYSPRKGLYCKHHAYTGSAIIPLRDDPVDEPSPLSQHFTFCFKVPLFWVHFCFVGADPTESNLIIDYIN